MTNLGNDAGDMDGKFQVCRAMVCKICGAEETDNPDGICTTSSVTMC